MDFLPLCLCLATALKQVGGAMQWVWAVLHLLSFSLCDPVLGVGVSCLWEEFFHIGLNLSGVCQIQQPAPPGCQGQSLRLNADGQLLLPNHHTHDSGNFTVPTVPGSHLHLRCMLACPGPEPNGVCDITISGGYPPSPPSPPQCYFRSGEHNLQCDWDPAGGALLPVNYTLSWEPLVAGSWFPGGITVTAPNAVIPRRELQRQSFMSVWVTASNGLGSAQSQKNTFNTGAVAKPGTPVITAHSAGPTDLEILWKMECSSYLSAMQDISCEAEYRRSDEDDIWMQGEDVAQIGFLLEGLEPFSAYMFRVRCACPGSQLRSDWSDTYIARTTEAAPVGILDVWCDSRETGQAVVWKKLPDFRARGRVLGYLVAVERAEGSWTELNVSEAQLGAMKGVSGPCCRLPLPLLGVTGVTVSASTAQGRTSPAPLALPMTGNPMPGVLSVSVVMGGRGFDVSWDPPSPLAETVEEYVLQQEEAGLEFTQGFAWTRTSKTQRNIELTGDFRNYTPYNLSLFGIIGGCSCLLGSVIAYTRQGVPPAVPGFQVSTIGSSDVTLTWQHIPLSQRRGIIQRFHLGQGNRTEYTVSRDSTSQQVSGLQPGQAYHFWVVAETEAGEGPKCTITFSTQNATGYNLFMFLALLPLLAIGPFVIGFLLSHRGALYSMLPVWCCEKVPGLTSGKLLLQMQTPVWNRSCPAVESDPNLCLLEVVEALPLKGGLAGVEGEQGQADEQEEREYSGTGGRGSDEENAEDEYTGITEDETQHFSDYEKHFMPSPTEVSCPGTHL